MEGNGHHQNGKKEKGDATITMEEYRKVLEKVIKEHKKTLDELAKR